MISFPNCKINLGLSVIEKRPDGFHNLETIMAKINLYDELFFEPSDSNEIELKCQGSHWAPDGKENLIYKAGKLFYEAIGQKPSVKITLTKNMPAGSGLGSASSDAASTLLGLNRFAQKQLPDEKLWAIAASLGSDVPFFLGGPLAFCSGRGEKIEKINEKMPFRALLVFPGISTSTKDVYENFKVDLPLFESLKSQINSYLEQNRLDLMTNMCANMLAGVSFDLDSELANVKTYSDSVCPTPVCLSGSGSSLFTIFAEADYLKIETAQREIKNTLGCDSTIVFSNEW